MAIAHTSSALTVAIAVLHGKQVLGVGVQAKVGVLSDSSPNLTSTSTCSTHMAENTYKKWY
jgi:hypothetical protein